MATIERPAGRQNSPRAATEILDRQPPHKHEAEHSVLGSLLLDPEMCDEVALVLADRDFYSPSHQTLYGHILAMHDEGRRIDATLLVDRLKKSSDFEVIGGLTFLQDVLHAVPTAANALYYAEIVRDKAT